MDKKYEIQEVELENIVGGFTGGVRVGINSSTIDTDSGGGGILNDGGFLTAKGADEQQTLALLPAVQK